jgi:putative transcriptional regulator
MPIRVKLDRILVERRMSLTELADRVGVTVANLSILKTGKARAVRFSTLDALCRALDCQPGELIAFEPGPPDSDEDELESLEAERAPQERPPPARAARPAPRGHKTS